MIKEADFDDGNVISRLHKIWCCSCYVPCNFLFHSCRKAVSKDKNRYERDGFDLDLTYITDKIIVHGFPATGIEHIYRNPRLEIRRFMDFYHHDNYKMYNFCCEPGRGYNSQIFYGRVERYPFKDHNIPPLETMAAFGNSAKLWLDENPKHVVNLHCKAGKGRAGMMCCVLLIRTGYASNAKLALEHYDDKRVLNKKRALTLTSQRKFVVFYEALWRKYWKVLGDIGAESGEESGPVRFIVPEQPTLHLTGIELLNMNPDFVKFVRIRVYKGTNFDPILLFDSSKVEENRTHFICDCHINGNFKILVQQTAGAFGHLKKLFELWHNTLFMSRSVKLICVCFT